MKAQLKAALEQKHNHTNEIAHLNSRREALETAGVEASEKLAHGDAELATLRTKLHEQLDDLSTVITIIVLLCISVSRKCEN